MGAVKRAMVHRAKEVYGSVVKGGGGEKQLKVIGGLM